MSVKCSVGLTNRQIEVSVFTSHNSFVTGSVLVLITFGVTGF